MSLHVLAGLLRLERGEHALAQRELETAERLALRIPNPGIRRVVSRVALPAFRVSVDVRSGRLDAARARLAEIRKAYQQPVATERWMFHAVEGELALAAGDLASAEAAFTAGQPDLKMDFMLGQLPPTVFNNNSLSNDGLARVRAAQGDLRGAIDLYQKLLTLDISSKWTAVLQPVYVLRLARLLEKSGDAGGAREQYKRFLELWKNADAGLPELEEARRKLS